MMSDTAPAFVERLIEAQDKPTRGHQELDHQGELGKMYRFCVFNWNRVFLF